MTNIPQPTSRKLVAMKLTAAEVAPVTATVVEFKGDPMSKRIGCKFDPVTGEASYTVYVWRKGANGEMQVPPEMKTTKSFRSALTAYNKAA